MAADGLIDQYVESFRRRVRSRRDRDDLADEVRDHLLTARERFEALGVEPHVAERRALARLGDPTLVASLLTEVPSKGSLMSLFLSRHLPAMSVAAAAAWIAAIVVAVYGQTGMVVPWTQEAYLVSSAVIGLACLLTTAVLVGLNVRATGELDTTTVVIAAVGALATVAAALLSWFIAIWLPLLAIAVVWTLVRAWATHAGSRPFTVVMLALMPLLAVGAIVATVLGQTMPVDTELLSWSILAGLAAVVAASLVDVAVRVGRRTARAAVAVAS
ncbi:permease prefix domain 1-containing protein [Microbacterium ulmi]|uniref:Uncharacterized protein n=1 Tax=Microbacterium ulmi TaxID=179095 RepID=A0A7Y2M2G9_9MICO|nr:hypothetical protein [Microbacterium ulmi]NNH05311.1 hypothetical protein [Microbacterium ulmi]